MAEKRYTGSCLCGAVTVTGVVDKPIIRACHCEMCRRHTSSMFMSLETVPGSQTVEGPAKEYESSDWANRGFCEECGSTLWYAMKNGAWRNLAAGLFENAADSSLKLEFFTDMCPQGYALSGGHQKMTTQETIAMFTGAGDQE